MNKLTYAMIIRLIIIMIILTIAILALAFNKTDMNKTDINKKDNIKKNNIKVPDHPILFNLEELTPDELEIVKMIWRNRLDNHFKIQLITRLESDIEELGAILRTLSTRFPVYYLIELDTMYVKMTMINRIIREKRGIRGTVIEV